MEDITPRSAGLRKAIADRRLEASANSRLLTVNEVCEYLRVSKWTLYRLIQSRRLKTVKIGSRRLVRLQSVIEFVEQQEAATGA